MAVPDLVQAQLDRHGVVPPKLIYDRAAGTGKKVAEVHEVSQGRTQLVVTLVDYQQRSDRFGPADFTLNPDDSLTCPGGVTVTTRHRSPHGTGYTYRFPAPGCAGCRLLAQCRGTAVHPERYRQVFISDYRQPYLRALAYSQTEDFKEDMKLRPGIERVIADLVQHNGARRARARGQDKADFQAKMSAMALNAKRWLVLLDEKEAQAKAAAEEAAAGCAA